MKATKQLDFLFNNLENLFIIHYSCQNLSDNNEGYSPRITSIAVLHERSRSMHSFSIHLYAEREGIPRDNIDNNYDKLELLMLEDFYGFVKNHPQAFWLHWNMTNINYGFEAIAHRFEVLSKKKAPQIDELKRFNLSTIVLAIYGRDCVDHPRMLKLMELNGGIDRDYLSGQHEVIAFNNKEYIKLHKSTMHKAYWFSHMLHLTKRRKVKTQHTNLMNKVERLCDSPIAKAIALLSALITIGSLIFYLKD